MKKENRIYYSVMATLIIMWLAINGLWELIENYLGGLPDIVQFLLMLPLGFLIWAFFVHVLGMMDKQNSEKE